MIAILDFQVGNIGSISNILRNLGVEHVVADQPSKMEHAEKLILPGIGSFDACVKGLYNSGLKPQLEEMVLAKRKPVLGICVGAQIMGVSSEEGEERGLGWMQMTSKKLIGNGDFKVPNIGWRPVTAVSTSCALTSVISKDTQFYFTHSYAMCPDKTSLISMVSDHSQPFAAAVSQNNIYAIQFHPEKSHHFGKFLFQRFSEL